MAVGDLVGCCFATTQNILGAVCGLLLCSSLNEFASEYILVDWRSVAVFWSVKSEKHLGVFEPTISRKIGPHSILNSCLTSALDRATVAMT